MMRVTMNKCLWAAGVLLAGEMVLSVAIGCNSSGKGAEAAGEEKPNGFFNPPEKGGAELWGENCGRCHNIRPPSQFSDAQWEVIVQHMRLRADLTGEEQRKITKFLQDSR